MTNFLNVTVIGCTLGCLLRLKPRFTPLAGHCPVHGLPDGGTKEVMTPQTSNRGAIHPQDDGSTTMDHTTAVGTPMGHLPAGLGLHSDHDHVSASHTDHRTGFPDWVQHPWSILSWVVLVSHLPWWLPLIWEGTP